MTIFSSLILSTSEKHKYYNYLKSSNLFIKYILRTQVKKFKTKNYFKNFGKIYQMSCFLTGKFQCDDLNCLLSTKLQFSYYICKQSKKEA